MEWKEFCWVLNIKHKKRTKCTRINLDKLTSVIHRDWIGILYHTVYCNFVISISLLEYKTMEVILLS